MRDILRIPVIQNALWVLAAGFAVPLLTGLLARIFFRHDEDDLRNHPGHKIARDSSGSGRSSPEPDLELKSWPKFEGSPRPPFAG